MFDFIIFLIETLLSLVWFILKIVIFIVIVSFILGLFMDFLEIVLKLLV